MIIDKPKLLSVSNIDDIVQIHILSFKDFFLTSLGSEFLKIYYTSCIRYKKTIAIGIFDEKDNLTGFAIGNSDAFGYHKRILASNLFPFILISFKLFLKSPSVLLRLFLNLNKFLQLFLFFLLRFVYNFP